MEVKKNKKLALLAASVAGLLAVTGVMIKNSTVQAADEAAGEKVSCYGVNQCKGTGECGGKGHSCAGKNACKGQGSVGMSQEECLKTEGGRLTAEPAV
ncbi:MAG: hypothetical protein HYZ84_06680 [Candidatus Omnitrophica bacterium]|nr:hypothetical protein [Candidatus Omnitrophota bacterium]